MKKNQSIIFFVILLVSVSIYYKYHEIVFKKPQSIHKWRQSDCASIALNYHQGGMRFFKPETHNLTSDGGTSGKVCTSEIPILYYSVAILYKVFGYHDWVYRIFNTLIFFLGLFYLFRLLLYLYNDSFWSIAITIFIFTSPVLVYYGNNYISNSSALAFVFVGWYYFTKYMFELRLKLLIISFAAFLLAASFKVTALFSMFAIAGTYFLELLGVKDFSNRKKLFQHQLYFVLSIVTILLIVGSWIIYADKFNKAHDTTYFSTTIFPIWDFSLEDIKGILVQIKKLWVPEYFHASALIFILICTLYVVVNFRRGNKFFVTISIILFVEAVLYFILQFWTFADHDYYTIDLFILPVILVVTAFLILKDRHSIVFNSFISKSIFGLLLVFNIYYANQRLKNRYDINSWMNDFKRNEAVYTATPFLRDLGISINDTVISIPDGSHASLYLMNQKGWTEYTDARFMRGESIRYNQDSIGVQKSINYGAKYILVNGFDQLYSKPYLQSFCTNLKGNYKDLLVFDLRTNNTNFSIKNREIVSHKICDVEVLSEDENYFVGLLDSSLFEGGATQSGEIGFNSKNSVKLNSESPFGMTITLDSLVNGESFEIYVWRYSENGTKGHLIASSEPNQFYHGNSKIVETDSTGWEKLSKEFFIGSELEGQELKIYVYNPEREPVFFDDLEIVRYKSFFDIGE